MLKATRIAAALALVGVLAAGCTSYGKYGQPALPATATTSVPQGAGDSSHANWDSTRAGWLKANGYPAWVLSADTFERHFRALCQRITAAYDGPLVIRARLIQRWNTDAEVAGKAGFGPMEFRASGVLDRFTHLPDCNAIGR